MDIQIEREKARMRERVHERNFGNPKLVRQILVVYF